MTNTPLSSTSELQECEEAFSDLKTYDLTCLHLLGEEMGGHRDKISCGIWVPQRSGSPEDCHGDGLGGFGGTLVYRIWEGLG